MRLENSDKFSGNECHRSLRGHLKFVREFDIQCCASALAMRARSKRVAGMTMCMCVCGHIYIYIYMYILTILHLWPSDPDFGLCRTHAPTHTHNDMKSQSAGIFTIALSVRRKINTCARAHTHIHIYIRIQVVPQS